MAIEKYEPINGNTAILPMVDFSLPKDLMERIPEKIRDDFRSIRGESFFWDKLSQMSTPFDYIKTREGGKSGDLEYFSVDYTFMMLNKLFPGWSMDGMDTKYIPEIRTFITTGYLFVSYITITGVKTRKVYAIGASEVFAKSSENNPSQPDDRAKASLTEWFKLAGKPLGIGLDIYTQSISTQMRAGFEELLIWIEFDNKELEDKLKNHLRAIAQTIETGKGFRAFLKSFPLQEEIVSFYQLINQKNEYNEMLVPDDMVDTESRHFKLWKVFLLDMNGRDAFVKSIQTKLASRK